jgi:hypothetical protein
VVALEDFEADFAPAWRVVDLAPCGAFTLALLFGAFGWCGAADWAGRVEGSGVPAGQYASEGHQRSARRTRTANTMSPMLNKRSRTLGMNSGRYTEKPHT